MFIYFLILLVPVLCALAKPSTGSKRDAGLFIYFLVLLIFTGLRDQVGPDWTGYINIYERVSGAALSDVFSEREPTFFLINKLSQTLDWDLYGVNLICATIFLAGIFMFARRTANAWLAIAAVTPYLIFVVSMSGVRQSAAIGICLLLLSRWEQSSLRFKLLMIALAASIHTSAVLLAIFLVIKFDRYTVIRLLAACAIASVAFISGGDSLNVITYYKKSYIENNLQSSGAYVQVMLSVLPALLFIAFNHRIRARFGENDLMKVAAWAVIAIFPLITISSTGVSRAALYFSFVQMWIYPAIAVLFGRQRMLVTAALGIFFVVIFLVYFTAGTFAFAYLPYRSILFGELL